MWRSALELGSLLLSEYLSVSERRWDLPLESPQGLRLRLAVRCVRVAVVSEGGAVPNR